jgi:tRNA acetyltransferase TAN1
MPRRDGIQSRAIKPGDAGIWATCAMKKEAKSVSDLRDLFQEVGYYLKMQMRELQHWRC